jgi:hypothetical protein
MYEPTQNEVKRKMIETDARSDVPKSPARFVREGKVRGPSQFALDDSSCVASALRAHQESASLRWYHGGVLRTFASLSAIYNERRF